MALVAGQCTADPPTGLAGRMFTKLQTAGASTLGMQPAAFTAGSPARNALAGLLEALAGAVVDEIAANASVAVTITTGNLGLQQYDIGGGPIDTLAPSAQRVLNGTIS